MPLRRTPSRWVRLVMPGAIALSLTFVTVAASAAAQAPAAIGHVVHQQGAITALQDTSPRVLHLGAEIYRGDRIITRANAKVEIRFSDGSTLSVGADTDVAVADYVDEGRRRAGLTLLLGIIRTRLSGLWDDGFAVRTRAAIASVRSTEWITESREDRSSVFVVTGRVAVTGTAGGARVTLEEGQGTDVETGGAPTPPKQWGSARVEDALSRTRLP